MTLITLNAALAPSNTTYIKATGGTGTITYSIVSGGGIINAATGLYTAPNAPAKVILKAVDSAIPTPNEATVTIEVMGALKLFADVLRRGLNLSTDQVYLYNQQFKIPPDDRIYIAIKYPDAKPFSNIQKYDGSGSGLNLIQETNFRANVMVDIMSKSTEAFDRKEEVLFAMTNDYAKRQQQKNGFSIARIPSTFVALNELEGAAIPYRFNITVGLQYAVRKVAAAEYYDEFRDVTVQTDP